VDRQDALDVLLVLNQAIAGLALMYAPTASSSAH
jgi:hypothetical protein